MSYNSKKFLIEVKTGKLQIKYLKCGKTVVASAAAGSGLVNSPINNSPYEFHLLGHNFTGPRTQLLWGKKRLNGDLAYKEFSKHINKVDEASYHLDKCYLIHKDTGTRNKICDKNMIKEIILKILSFEKE